MRWEFQIPFDIKDDERFIEARKVFENGTFEGPFILSPVELAGALQELTSKSTSGFMAIPFMPENVVYSAPSKDLVSYHILLKCDAEKRFIRYQNGSGYFIDVPPLLMDIIVYRTPQECWKVKGVRLFALDSFQVSADSKLYNFPFTHVIKNGSGSICWGTNVLPLFTELTELPKLFTLFFAAAFGEDYGMALLSGAQNFLKYCKENEDKPFNYDDLLPTGKIVRDLI